MKFLKLDVGLTDMRWTAFNIFMSHWVNLEILNRLEILLPCCTRSFRSTKLPQILLSCCTRSFRSTNLPQILLSCCTRSFRSTNLPQILLSCCTRRFRSTNLPQILVDDSLHILSYRCWNHCEKGECGHEILENIYGIRCFILLT